MRTTTIYRADNYFNNMGNLLGFFESIESAKNELEFSNEAKVADGTFSQITEFTVLTSEFKKGKIKDSEFMAKLWGVGEIVNEYYFTE